MSFPLELVSLTTADGVRLDGSVVVPEQRRDLGFDAVILHHGVGSNFYGTSFFGPMQEWLSQAGCAVLRVNNRGHELAYNTPRGRLGAAFELVADSVQDWTAWLDFAAARGWHRVVLWGHSLGAVKTIFFLATQQDPRIVRAIAASPPLFSFSEYQTKEGAAQFQEQWHRGQELLAQGKPDELMPVTVPTRALLTARTYTEKYGPDERFNILRLLPAVRIPLLLTLGGEEGAGPHQPDWLAFGGLANRLQELASGLERAEFRLIPEANHRYEHKEAELWSAVAAWLGLSIPNLAPSAAKPTVSHPGR
ncbi:MAG: alpha/beta hydrolase [Chloroflexota bacterium]